MSVLLRTLLQATEKKYHISVLAGQEGLDNLVTWINTVEETDAAAYLRPHSLVITTGARRTDMNWVPRFCRAVYAAGASCLILNIRGNLQEVPREALDFCEENKLALLSMPWEVPLVELNQIYNRILFQNEQKKNNVNDLLKSVLEKPESHSYIQGRLASFGWAEATVYTPIILAPLIQNKGEVIDQLERLENKFEQLFHKSYVNINVGILPWRDKLLLVVPNMWSQELLLLLKEVKKSLPFAYVTAIGPSRAGIAKLQDYVRHTERLLKLAEMQQKDFLAYADTGVYQLVLSSEEQLLKELLYKNLKPLMVYDKVNRSNYVEFLRHYMECGYSIQLLAEEEHLHRNSVYYHLHKIEEILKIDLGDWEERLLLKLSYCIYDFEEK